MAKKLKIWDYFKVGGKAFIGRLAASIAMFVPLLFILLIAQGNVFAILIMMIVYVPAMFVVEGFIQNRLWTWK